MSEPLDNKASPLLGLLAGNGDFPIEFAKRAKEKGFSLVTVGYPDETSPDLESLSSQFSLVRIGQLAKAIRIFNRHEVKRICILGGIRRFRFFGGIKPDWRAFRVISRALSLHDDALLTSLTKEFEHAGFEVIPASFLLDDFLARRGVLSRRGLSRQQREQAMIGWKAAQTLGELDIGQTVIVHQRLVVAVEASEGTDETIRRAGRLNAKGAIVVKRCKPQQDKRVDLPSVGPTTIEVMKEAGMKALVLEHEGAHILKPQEVVKLADSAGIIVEVF